MKKKWYRNFAEWNAPAVKQVFDLKRTETSAAIDEWLNPVNSDHSAVVSIDLENLRQNLAQFKFGWNEYELMAGFIAPLLATVSFVGENYAMFHQRPLSLQVDGQLTEGKVDGLVALGQYEPERPFFFLHEYKKSQGYDADPEGQLLIAMVAAQRLNDDGLPLYGCYIVGSYWRFVLLDGKNYAVSQGYDATDAEELRIIWSVLQHTKRIVEERVRLLLESEE